jgi:hypothetical protein
MDYPIPLACNLILMKRRSGSGTICLARYSATRNDAVPRHVRDMPTQSSNVRSPGVERKTYARTEFFLVCERVSDHGPSRRFGLHRGRRPKATREERTDETYRVALQHAQGGMNSGAPWTLWRNGFCLAGRQVQGSKQGTGHEHRWLLIMSGKIRHVYPWDAPVCRR